MDLGGATFAGEVSFAGAQIAGDLRMERCNVDDQLTLDRLTIDSWEPDPEDEEARDRSSSPGTLALRGAHLGAAQLRGPARVAASVDAAQLIVDHNFELENLTLGGPTLDLSGVQIEGCLSVDKVQPAGSSPAVKVTLQSLSVGELDDGEESWPNRPSDTHYIDNISIGTVRAASKDWRIKWLKGNAIWTPQPWQEVSAALKRDGHDSEARAVAVAREDEHRKEGGLPWWSKAGRWVSRWTIGYGYRPIYSLVWAVAIIGICAAAFTYLGDLHPERGAPNSSTILYSVDAFLPVDLGYFGAWTPEQTWLSAVAAVEVACGWLLAALLVGALTGLLKKD